MLPNNTPALTTQCQAAQGGVNNYLSSYSLDGDEELSELMNHPGLTLDAKTPNSNQFNSSLFV